MYCNILANARLSRLPHSSHVQVQLPLKLHNLRQRKVKQALVSLLVKAVLACSTRLDDALLLLRLAVPQARAGDA